MAILDNQTLLSDRQAITATVASTNTIDLSPISAGVRRDIGAGSNVPLLIQVVEQFNNLTSLTVTVETDDNSAFSSPKTVMSSGAIPLASLVAGYQFNIDNFPRGTDERFVQLRYTVVGTAPTLGRVTAGVTLGGAQTNG